MSTQLYVMGALGGLLPDVLRLLAWTKLAPGVRGPLPVRDPAIWLGMVLQVGLGVLAAYALEPATVLQALAMGYAAPEMLTRAFAAFVKSGGQAAGFAVNQPSAGRRVLGWWST